MTGSATERANPRLSALRARETLAWDNLSLLDHRHLTDHATLWPVRDQRHRSTCNAFAVVAAEELWHWRQTGTLKPLSEELLYRAMRDQPVPMPEPPKPGEDPGAVQAAKQAEADAEGTTFLAQALDVLRASALHPASAGPYEAGSGLKKNHKTNRPEPLSAAAPQTAWLHNIAKNADILDGVTWANGGVRDPMSLATLVHERLLDGVPVIATLALPDGVGIEAFMGANGRFAGEVFYPPIPALPAGTQTRFGHTVCILGYRQGRQSANPADGFFLFRNSLGVVRQSSLAGRSDDPRLPPWPGYGYISVQDLETYCWEFLCRA